MVVIQETSTKSFKVKSESSGKVKEELQTGQSVSKDIYLYNSYKQMHILNVRKS